MLLDNVEPAVVLAATSFAIELQICSTRPWLRVDQAM